MSESQKGRGALLAGGLAAILASTCCLGPLVLIALGFSLDEVAGLLRLDDGTHCNDARVHAEQKLEDVRGKLADLRRIELVLAQLVDDCCASHGTVSCPLIDSLHGIDSHENFAP